MEISEVTIPKMMNYRELMSWSDQIDNVKNGGGLILNFRQVNFMTPFPMIFILHRVRAMQRLKSKCKLQLKNISQLGFAAHMGFFKELGADLKDFPKPAAQGDINYLPITIINKSEFTGGAMGHGVHEIIEQESIRLTRVLTRTHYGATFDTIQFSIREIVRNVFEHSG